MTAEEVAAAHDEAVKDAIWKVPCRATEQAFTLNDLLEQVRAPDADPRAIKFLFFEASGRAFPEPFDRITGRLIINSLRDLADRRIDELGDNHLRLLMDARDGYIVGHMCRLATTLAQHAPGRADVRQRLHTLLRMFELATYEPPTKENVAEVRAAVAAAAAAEDVDAAADIPDALQEALCALGEIQAETAFHDAKAKVTAMNAAKVGRTCEDAASEIAAAQAATVVAAAV